MYPFFRKYLFKLDAETAHGLTLSALRLAGNFAPSRWVLQAAYGTRSKPVSAFGLSFKNPVGLAAGYDKDCLGWRGLACLGFGHIETGTVTLRNSIIAENRGYDCAGSITSSGYNLIGRDTTTCSFTANSGDKVGTEISPINPRLTPLTDHGGPTLTHALMAGSPAINAGNPETPGSGARACLPTDQRGVARPSKETPASRRGKSSAP